MHKKIYAERSSERRKERKKESDRVAIDAHIL